MTFDATVSAIRNEMSLSSFKCSLLWFYVYRGVCYFPEQNVPQVFLVGHKSVRFQKQFLNFLLKFCLKYGSYVASSIAVCGK